MESNNLSQEIIEKLYNEYIVIGYITEECVLDMIVEHNLPLDEVDFICDYLLSMGVIICDTFAENLEDEGDYDRSQTDYEELFKEVVEIDESIAPFINEIRQIRPPQHREWQNLIKHAKNGNTFANKRMIEMYLRTVVKIALWHHKKYDIPLSEAIQDGCIGLIIALDKYEISKQDVFATYAPWWIRQNITRKASTKNPLVRFPVHVKDKLFNIYETLEQCYCCKQINCNEHCKRLLEAVSEKLECNEDEAEKYLSYLNPFESIEGLLEVDESIFNDYCAIEEKIHMRIKRKELKDAVSAVLQTLKPREKEILLLRFGFTDGKERTLEEIGNKYGLTRERIRQIEKKAIKKLRHPSRSQMLKGFLT